MSSFDNSLNSSSTFAHKLTTLAFSLDAYSFTCSTYALSGLPNSSSFILAKYIIGFRVKKLYDFNNFNSSSVYSTCLNGLFSSKAIFDFSSASTSVISSLFFVVLAFFATLSSLLYI